MSKRTDDLALIIKALSEKTGVKDLPRDYKYKLDIRKKCLTLTLLEKGLKANMQNNESAFESWAIILKYYLDDIVKTVMIDWEDLHGNENNNLHFNRFVYRLSMFLQTFDWAISAREIPPIPSILFCNCPGGNASPAEKQAKGSEGWIECKYVEQFHDQFDVIDHQLPVGIFYDSVSRTTHYTTGQKSAIDIWAIKNNDLFIFELKKPKSKPLGIISEIMFYTNIINDILSHRIRYPNNSKMLQAVKGNYRSFKYLYDAYSSGKIQNINAVLLADDIHPLITQELLDFINESARLKYCRIKYAMQNAKIQV